MRSLPLCLLFLTITCQVEAEPPAHSVRVFVALCDNKTQGIVPVGAKIGNGDLPDDNLYWGCSDGLPGVFKRSPHWKRSGLESDISHDILRRLTLRHATADIELVADAYRGSSMRACLEAFQAAAASGQHDLVAFIGHNGLMDFQLPPPATQTPHPRETSSIVLCCLSQRYFEERLTAMHARPVLLTRQLMYPAAILLHDALEVWRKDGSLSAIRQAAAKAYAANQKISTRSALGVFAELAPATQ